MIIQCSRRGPSFTRPRSSSAPIRPFSTTKPHSNWADEMDYQDGKMQAAPSRAHSYFAHTRQGLEGLGLQCTVTRMNVIQSFEGWHSRFISSSIVTVIVIVDRRSSSIIVVVHPSSIISHPPLPLRRRRHPHHHRDRHRPYCCCGSASVVVIYVSIAISTVPLKRRAKPLPMWRNRRRPASSAPTPITICM